MMTVSFVFDKSRLTIPSEYRTVRRDTLHKAPEQRTPEFISVGFIAKGCGVSNTTVLRWISTGQLPAFRLPGGHYRIERANFSEFLVKHSIPALFK
jgi:excisionase family DNA binding protein